MRPSTPIQKWLVITGVCVVGMGHDSSSVVQLPVCGPYSCNTNSHGVTKRTWVTLFLCLVIAFVSGD